MQPPLSPWISGAGNRLCVATGSVTILLEVGSAVAKADAVIKTKVVRALTDGIDNIGQAGPAVRDFGTTRREREDGVLGLYMAGRDEEVDERSESKQNVHSDDTAADERRRKWMGRNL